MPANRPELKSTTKDPHAACIRELARIQAQRDHLARLVLEVADEWEELDADAREALRSFGRLRRLAQEVEPEVSS